MIPEGPAIRAVERLQEVAELSDREAAHLEADDVLTTLVAYYVPKGSEIEDLFNAIGKWYS